MELIGTIIAAVISAIAAIYIAWYKIGFSVDGRKLRSFDKGFKMAGRLSQEALFKSGDVRGSKIKKSKKQFDSWWNKAGPIANDETVRAFYALSEALSAPAKDDGMMSRNSKNEIWRQRNRLRGCIKEEIKAIKAK